MITVLLGNLREKLPPNFRMLARTTMSRAFSAAALAHTFTGAVGNTPLVRINHP
jgi:hypothetical protein